MGPIVVQVGSNPTAHAAQQRCATQQGVHVQGEGGGGGGLTLSSVLDQGCRPSAALASLMLFRNCHIVLTI